MRLNDDHPLDSNSYDKKPNDLCFIYGDETERVGVVVFTFKAKAWLTGFRRQLATYTKKRPEGITIDFSEMEKLGNAAREDGLRVDARSRFSPS
jgi:hypothetical protein